MKIVVCDDELCFVEMISNYCEKFVLNNKIPITLLKFVKGIDVIGYYKENRDIDLFILDIKMESVNGLKVAEEIRKNEINTKIVFLTSVIEFAPQGYVLGVNRYWLKPLSYEKFSSEMMTLYKEIQKESIAYFLENMGTTITKVYYDDIFYIETHGRKVCVHKTNSDYISRSKLIEYEKKLDARFFRCHAAYIVNMNYISKVIGLEIILINGERIYMSKGKRKKFLAALNDYYNKKDNIS